jgi:hypothetical protein
MRNWNRPKWKYNRKAALLVLAAWLNASPTAKASQPSANATGNTSISEINDIKYKLKTTGNTSRLYNNPVDKSLRRSP